MFSRLYFIQLSHSYDPDCRVWFVEFFCFFFKKLTFLSISSFDTGFVWDSTLASFFFFLYRSHDMACMVAMPDQVHPCHFLLFFLHIRLIEILTFLYFFNYYFVARYHAFLTFFFLEKKEEIVPHASFFSWLGLYP